MHDTRSILTTLAVLVCLAAMPAAPAAAVSPWELLADMRVALEEDGPLTGKFEQTYIPAGFSDGDVESGYLSLWLPRCLRWNYEEPQEKSFLLCDGEVYFWNPEDEGGRHYEIDPKEEPGLDLLMLGVSELRERYVADSEKLADGTYRISLAVPADVGGDFHATIHVDPVARRVVGLEYTDDEGNLTRFAISDYQKLAHTGLFQPPQGIEWTDE
jgi:outer membrane lipoprotein-sorting protein